MASVLALADDLTGSNATAALYARRGLTTLVVSDVAHALRHGHRVDTLVVNTDSRHLSAVAAAAAVQRVLAALPIPTLVVKRVDTTLRGNVGAELAAALRGVRQAYPKERVRALVVPAFPEAGRSTVGGIHLVDGVPLAETAAGSDPLTPVRFSRVATVVRSQSDLAGLTVGEVALDDWPRLEQALRAPVDVLVCDAATREHLEALAGAAARVGRGDGVRWVSVDSGPFGAALAGALGVGAGAGQAPPILVVSGSITTRSREQLDEAERLLGARLVAATPAELAVDQVTARVGSLLADGAPVTGVRMLVPERVDPAAAEWIPGRLGAITASLLSTYRFGGLYVTGGDVATAVARALGAEGLAVDAEVLPLAVAGRLVGGPYAGLAFASKGGLVGDGRAAVACLEHLRLVERTQQQPTTLPEARTPVGSGQSGQYGRGEQPVDRREQEKR